ncbi:MAG TPA: RES domain-containing protein [Chthoniobacterales bacterium]|jgi:RES domain-containing protein|nr:RES domain-containing protein [Chthoniobacterales bacterium]
MPSGWRIDKPGRDAFAGEGAKRFGGRWNSPGVAVVYLSEHQSLAALEIFVHLQPLLPRQKYLAYFVEWEEAQMETLSPKKLPPDWRSSPPGPATMQLGDQWAREERSVVIAVPSVILPSERNFLINPAHPMFRQLRWHKPVEFAFDERMAGR